MMMFLDLFPVGMYQLVVVFQEGFWYARSQEVIQGTVFQAFTYFRAFGIAVFVIGGVVPLIWFILSRGLRLQREVEVEEGEWTVYEKDWAGQEDPILGRSGGVGPDPV